MLSVVWKFHRGILQCSLCGDSVCSLLGSLQIKKVRRIVGMLFVDLFLVSFIRPAHLLLLGH